MNKCIFCGTSSGPFSTREHILPESLGGGDGALLPDGLFCDSCQNRFGSHVEQMAIGDFPFSLVRVMLGIPTKKGKAPWVKTWEGVLHGHPAPGVVSYDPTPMFEAATLCGKKTVIRVLAETRRPDMVCRMLLKMGIERLALDGDIVFEARFEPARVFALSGQKPGTWWYVQHTDMCNGPQNLDRNFPFLRW